MSQCRLLERIEAYINHLKEMFVRIHKEEGHHGEPPSVKASYSERWCKITRTSLGSESVYAFVSLIDVETKSLGSVKAGDIHKPASWKAPSKHSRGNIFDENFGNCSDYFSIRYLRGG